MLEALQVHMSVCGSGFVCVYKYMHHCKNNLFFVTSVSKTTDFRFIVISTVISYSVYLVKKKKLTGIK